MKKIGDRVGVIFGSDGDTMEVQFLGYGKYVGDEIPEEAAGCMAEACR